LVASTRTLLQVLLAIVVALALSVAQVQSQSLPTPTEGAGYLPAPLSQPSISTTAFDPALTNAGGTTNSAGTFNVVSLSRSSSHDFAADGAGTVQTTTFAAGAPVYGSQQVLAGTYNTNSGATTSLLSGTAAATNTGVDTGTTGSTGSDNAGGRLAPADVTQTLGLLAIVAVAMLAGAGVVL
jgi:hypothetical protein